MIIKNFIYKLILFVACIPALGYAQNKPQQTEKFSAAIIARVAEISAKIEISEHTRLLLSRHFRHLDSLANVAAKQGASSKDISKYYVNDDANLQPILSAIEINDYSVSDVSSSSKLAIAIKFRRELNLAPSHVDNLIEAKRAMANTPELYSTEFENKQLVKNLNKGQLKYVLNVINRKSALNAAHSDWEKLKRANLTVGIDSSKALAELSIYHNSEIVESEYQNISHTDTVRFFLDKPKLLLKMDALKKSPRELYLAALIKYREELKLTANELDETLNGVIRLDEQYKLAEINDLDVPDTKKAQLDIALQVLKTQDRYNKFFVLKNHATAQRQTKIVFTNLKHLSLLKAVDSIKIKAQLFVYESNLWTGIDKVVELNRDAATDSIKRKLELYKPVILWKLDAFNNDLPKSKFAELMKYNKYLKLTDDQVDTLVNNAIALDKMEHHSKTAQMAREYEIRAVSKLLTYSQLNTFLAISNQNPAMERTKKDWERWRVAGLTKDLDSTKVNRENLAFHLSYLMTQERSLYDLQNRTAYLKNLERNRPPELKKIDDALKVIIGNAKLKDNLTF